MNINKIGSNDNPNNTTSDMPNNLTSSLNFRGVIGDVLTEKGNIIWGHGTQDKEICDSICKTGLRIGNADTTDSQVTFSLCNDFNTGSNNRQKNFLTCSWIGHIVNQNIL